MGVRKLLGSLGLVLLCAAWGVLLFGLFGLPASDDPMVELEAGPSFAINLEVYLPAIVLTLVLLLAVLAVLRDRAATAVGIGAALVAGAFAAWVLNEEPLLDYLPQLRSTLLFSGGLSMLSLLLFLGRSAVTLEPQARSTDPSISPTWAPPRF
ncbi:hypothetical protein [Pedococcus soli]